MNKIPIIQDESGQFLNTDRDKANGFASYFSTLSTENKDLGLKYFSTKITKTVNQTVNKEIVIDEIKFASCKEVSDAIKSLKNNKAAGSDNISAKFLKNLPRKGIVYLVKIINGIFMTGHFPSEWKVATVVPIHKKNKDDTKIQNYRPISLLSHVSKVVEKVIKSRIIGFLTKNKLLVNEQFGFRGGHSTTDQLMRLVNHITKNFNLKKHTGAILLDIASAFPTVWFDGLIFKLIVNNFPLYLIILLHSYIRNRSIYVQLNNFISLIFDLCAGVPQGSVLGPILFLIFVNDAPRVKDVEDSIIADDKLMFTSSYRISAIINKLQRALDLNKKFFNKWKIKLNDSKTEAIIFTKRRPNIPSNIFVNNAPILWAENIKYLGITLDNKLVFTQHVNKIIQRAIGNLIILYPLLNRNSILSTENKLLLYKAIVRSAMSYACPVWSMICNSKYDKLQVVQNKFLRLAGNFNRYSYIKQMHDCLNVEFFECFVKRITKNYFDKLDNHTNILMKEMKYNKQQVFKHRRVMHII